MSLFPGAAFARRATALHNLVLVEQVFGHGTNRGKLEKTLFLKYQCRSFPCNFVYKNQTIRLYQCQSLTTLLGQFIL